MDEKDKDNKKNKQLDEHRRETGRDLSTNHGTKISNNQDQLKAGDRGPVLMEDFIFREKMTHFDHERIPERVVHARGSAAHGYFQPYESLADLTKAGFLQDPNKKTPVFVRFSTVVGFRGSADTVRDVRGFATKFYTDEGNYDLVGNNMAPFFIQDAMKFPDLVHSIKPEPHNEMPQASAAHDNFWDFVSLSPESLHMIMWVISDRALPRSYAMMEGFGVHTFTMINKEGKSRFVKFHWKPVLGKHSLVWDEVQKLAGKDPDFNRKDLWQRIEDGDFPEFELGIQVLEEEDEFKFEFDILDATKIWPEEDVPVRKIGKMVLNRNPDNFFAETEQVAFHPGHVVPGIDFTNDPLLQGRLFSYVDTQLIRLGGPNFSEIPINRPVCPVHNNQRDGFMRQTINKGRVNYEPNSLAEGCPMANPAEMGGFVSYMEKMHGAKVRAKNDSFRDHYSQSVMFWNSMTKPEQKHMISAFHFELGKVEHMHIRERMVGHLTYIDLELAQEVAKGIGVEPPTEGYVKDNGKRSPALSMGNEKQDNIKTRKVAILVEDGYNHKELMQVKDFLKDAGAKSEVISKFLGMKKSSSGEEVKVDKMHSAAESLFYDAVFVPGGEESVKKMMDMGDAIHFVNEAFRHCKPIAATSEGCDLFNAADLKGVFIAKDDNIGDEKGVVTVRHPDELATFCLKFKDAIAMHRHWEREEKDQVPA